jgi:hypothetical protein
MACPAASRRNTGMPGPTDTVVEIEIQMPAVPGRGTGEDDCNTDGAGIAAPEIQTLQRGA